MILWDVQVWPIPRVSPGLLFEAREYLLIKHHVSGEDCDLIISSSQILLLCFICFCFMTFQKRTISYNFIVEQFNLPLGLQRLHKRQSSSLRFVTRTRGLLQQGPRNATRGREQEVGCVETHARNGATEGLGAP